MLSLDYMSFPVHLQFIEIDTFLEACNEYWKIQVSNLRAQMKSEGELSNSSGVPSSVLSQVVYYDLQHQSHVLIIKGIPIGPSWASATSPTCEGVRTLPRAEVRIDVKEPQGPLEDPKRDDVDNVLRRCGPVDLNEFWKLDFDKIVAECYKNSEVGLIY